MSKTYEMQIEGHKLVALSFNPDTPGAPIILLHGITASIGTFTPDELPLLISRGPCYSLSLPGHYPAVFPPDFQDALTAEIIAHLLTEDIRELVGERPVVLVGHSTGGFAALAIAAHTPELARYVISIAGFAQGRWSGVLGLNQGLVRRGSLGRKLFKLGYELNRCTRTGHRAMLRLYAANPRALYAYPHLDTIIDNYFSYLKRLDLEAMADYFTVMPGIDIGPLLPRITAPVLVVTGDRDPVVLPSQAHLVANTVPHADLAVIDSAGHLVFWENPAQYNRVVDEWLRARYRPDQSSD
jgi:pimeloyl-ACP methyl ester carboxylesterase